ncbi:NUDIX domain-containing protein [Thermogymnomonas acidicola]|uniref:NUDIX domain-containing protein n=1 Tax=Thermogymnomonas acidicola TaxID=399579 RepID=UPI000946207A|nr:NUDIX domain-containing protein [Thermogymnomonas acidicola]
MPTGRKVQAVIFRDTGRREFLLFHYVPAKGGYWENMTCNVEEGETDTDALMRELAEEASLGAGCVVYGPRLLFTYDYEKNGGARFTESVYAVGVGPGCVPDISRNLRGSTQSAGGAA